MASKIVVLGHVNGQLHSAFKRLAALHTKNNFAFAIITGNLFAADDSAVADLLDHSIHIPLPTYFTVGTNALPQRVIEKLEKDEELCDNLHFLGKRSTTRTSEGIKIVTLGGQLDPAIIGGVSQDKFLPFHTIGDAKALHGANTADILLTATWPSSITRGSRQSLPDGIIIPDGYDHISELCATLKPRYHFSPTSSDFFYEREPFYHAPSIDFPDLKHVTRFLSIASHGNEKKAKAIYAFTLPKDIDHTQPLPEGTTMAPFSRPRKRQALDAEPYSRYRGDTSHHDHKRSKGRGGNRQPPPGPDECFFCLSKKDLATHLITSIGDESYVTMAKGPLTTSTTFKEIGLDFPAHALIIPLTHSPTLASILEENDAKAKTWAEMNKFKEALQHMVAAKSNGKLGAVTYEISKRRGIHTHWQFVPMPVKEIKQNLVHGGFVVEASNRNYPEFEVRDPGIGENEGDFIRVWIWTPPAETSSENPAPGTTKCITLRIDESFRFDLQFGRAVLAKLLNLENRIQWRDCEQTVEEETKENELFKGAFKPFDFT